MRWLLAAGLMLFKVPVLAQDYYSVMADTNGVVQGTHSFSGSWTGQLVFTSTISVGPTAPTLVADYSAIAKGMFTKIASTQAVNQDGVEFTGLLANYSYRFVIVYSQLVSNSATAWALRVSTSSSGPLDNGVHYYWGGIFANGGATASIGSGSGVKTSGCLFQNSGGTFNGASGDNLSAEYSWHNFYGTTPGFVGYYKTVYTFNSGGNSATEAGTCQYLGSGSNPIVAIGFIPPVNSTALVELWASPDL